MHGLSGIPGGPFLLGKVDGNVNIKHLNVLICFFFEYIFVVVDV